MAKIMIEFEVPDGNTCKGCGYLTTVHPGTQAKPKSGECRMFKDQEVPNFKKLPECEAVIEKARTTLTIALTPEDERKTLKRIFDLVCDKDNWKNPINTWIPKDAATPEQISDAVVYFTAGHPTVVEQKRYGKPGYRVTAPGYYVSCGS